MKRTWHISHARAVQLGELLALLKILAESQNEPVKIFSDGQYTVQAAVSSLSQELKIL